MLRGSNFQQRPIAQAVAIGYVAGGVFYLWRNRQDPTIVRFETGDRSF